MGTTTAVAATTIARSDLAGALRLAASIKAKTVHIDLGDEPSVSAYATDAAVRVPLDVTPSDGAIVMDRVALARLLACCDSRLQASIEDDRLVIQSGPSTYSLPSYVDLGPRHDLGSDITDAVTIEAPVLWEALRRALPSVSRDFTRPLLCCAALFPGRNTIVSTDSYRLTVVRYGDDDKRAETPWLLTRDGVIAIQRALAKKLGQVEMWQTATHVHVRFEGLRWALRRVDGQFPSYEKLLPDPAGDTTMTVDRVDLLAAARGALLVGARSEPLRLKIGEACSAALGSSTDTASMKRDLTSAVVDGPALEIGLNPAYLADACATAPVERLTLRFIAPLRPLMIEAARDTYLLMPIRLKV